MKLAIDVDYTLVDTDSFRVHRRTPGGRKFATDNIDRFNTRVYDSRLVDLVNEYHRRGDVVLFSNSPADYVRALVRKHGFPSDVPVVGSAQKPLSDAFLKFARNPREWVVVGDSPKDVLCAHGAGSVSFGVSWGVDLPVEQLRLAEPSRVAGSVDELLSFIDDAQRGKIEYVPRSLPKDFLFANGQGRVDVNYSSCGTYSPGDWSGNKFSAAVLNFKNASDVFPKDINTAVIEFFSVKQQRVIGWDLYRDVFMKFIGLVEQKIRSLAIDSGIIVPVPNSNPRYCYRSFPNELLANTVKARLGDGWSVERCVYRVFPKPKSSRSGERLIDSHLSSLGFRGSVSANNVVLLDDVLTSGSQLQAAARVLRSVGVGEKYFGIALAQTGYDDVK